MNLIIFDYFKMFLIVLQCYFMDFDSKKEVYWVKSLMKLEFFIMFVGVWCYIGFQLNLRFDEFRFVKVMFV